MEFETGAPNLTTAFDDNVSFFVISSNLTIHLSLFLAVCGATCFVCNFRNPCTISAPKHRKKTEKVFDIYRPKILLTHTTKNICCLKWRPSRWLNVIYLKQISMYEYVYFRWKSTIFRERREIETTRKIIMTLIRSGNVLQSDWRSGRVLFRLQGLSKPGNPSQE